MRLDDPARIAALNASGLLRMPLSDRLVHLCYTATVLLDADCSQLNAVTDLYQLTVAEWPRVPPRKPQSLANSGCQEVVISEHPLVLSDVRAHPVLCTMPWTNIWASYIGAPVLYEGQILGSLCALSAMSRQWAARDVRAIEGLAALASDAVVAEAERREPQGS